MQNKAIVHIMTKSRMRSDAFTAEIDAMEELSEKYGINNIIFYKWEVIEYKDLINKLEKFWIHLCNYSNKEELKDQVLKLSKEKEIIFVSTPMELLVNIVNELKVFLGHVLSDDIDIFRDKYLQRKMIQEHNPDLWVRFMTGTPENLQIAEIEKKIWYPFIIKPVDGVSSSWVAKVKNRAEYDSYMATYMDFHDRLKARGVDSKDLLIEDFITGQLYSVDYFVTQQWEIRMSKPVKVRLAVDVWIEDYANITRIATEKTEEDFKGKRLKTFINSTIKATGVRNTFVHHEFKINKAGDFKTIELNGRIWWGRLDLMQRTYGLNLYELIVSEDVKPWKLKENNMVMIIYATKRWILLDFNRKLLDKISQRPSVLSMELEEWKVGKEVWLTKDGFIKLGTIKMAHKDYKTLRKDYLYIKNKYLDLLKIQDILKVNTQRKSMFHKVKEFIYK